MVNKKPRTRVRVCVTIPYDLKADLDELAQEQRTNRSEIVVRLLKEILSSEESIILHNFRDARRKLSHIQHDMVLHNIKQEK